MNKIYKFMDGRYGIDELYKFLLIICTILILLNTIIKKQNNRYHRTNNINNINNKIFIKKQIQKAKRKPNIYQNKKQNYKILSISKKRYQDHNTHIYRKCPKCKQKIRLPLKKGKHTVKCPNCQHHFIVKCPRNEKKKIEIVK